MTQMSCPRLPMPPGDWSWSKTTSRRCQGAPENGSRKARPLDLVCRCSQIIVGWCCEWQQRVSRRTFPSSSQKPPDPLLRSTIRTFRYKADGVSTSEKVSGHYSPIFPVTCCIPQLFRSAFTSFFFFGNENANIITLVFNIHYIHGQMPSIAYIFSIHGEWF